MGFARVNRGGVFLLSLWALLVGLIFAPPGWSSIAIPGADGSDGELHITTDTTLDLGLAATGQWDASSPVAGKGVYDPEQWAVVYKFTEVTVDAGAILTFVNNASRAPVVFLVGGPVNINGTVELSGASGAPSTEAATMAEPGPGGFRGGLAHRGDMEKQRGSAGFGPGGGNTGGSSASGGGFGQEGLGWWLTRGTRYGNHRLIPLVGGSGGSPAPGTTSAGGAAGGGALLLATTGTLQLNGVIRANGGNGVENSGGGSGGGVRIISDVFGGSGTITALGGSGAQAGGVGRVRVECNTNVFTGNLNPGPYQEAAAANIQLWPNPDTEASIRVVSVGGAEMPADPNGRMAYGQTDIALETGGNEEIVLEARNMPTTAKVWVLVVPLHGVRSDIAATLVSGDATSSLWKATLNLKNGVSSFQVRVDL